MQSINFEYLRVKVPDLAELGGFAEAYAHSDPSSAAVKLRTFAERMVYTMYEDSGIAVPVKPNLNDLLRYPDFTRHVPKPVLLKLDAVRIHGNKAAHGESVTQKTGLWLLQECHDLGAWFFRTYLDGQPDDVPQFREPPTGGAGGTAQAEMEVRLAELLRQLDDAKHRAEAAEQRIAQAREPNLASMVAEEHQDYRARDMSQPQPRLVGGEVELPSLATIERRGYRIADELGFDEATTRKRLIDSQLVQAGWSVDPSGVSNDDVGQEIEVRHQPTDSGLGYADYVLWDHNGKPLAVVEAKKTVESAEKGQTQARLYADGLERMHGQRPIIFYTNGFDLWIWDDAQRYPPRQIFGYYSRDSLQHLVNQRVAQKALNSLPIRHDIVDRIYQHECIKRVCERFTSQHRKALIVQATGTGKTRVAVALAELMIRAGWAKRILFLCDRRELRKQAKNAFKQFIPSEPIVTVTARTAKNRDERLYFATYPAMQRIYQSFDTGFFDLVIADESHRSIYNSYGDLFRYFDALQVGLTATPVEFVLRNTFDLFECQTGNPTFNYPYERAVSEGYLVPFEVVTCTTEFLRRGIKYEQLSEAQREELEDQGEDPRLLDYDPRQLDKAIFNRDTNRLIIRNLMERGIRDATGQEVGKSIIFARNHGHAILLRQVFDELYPQYGGRFCQVIDNYDPRAEQLIDDFKQPENELTVAISVDMLDTGIDVPEVVNLVFAKPVFSKVKFWQMIGRGTRLRENLFGVGKNKKSFRIFDHWGNFDYFEFQYQHREPSNEKSLMQLLFEARVDLAGAVLEASQPRLFNAVAALLEEDLNALDERTIAVRQKWRERRSLARREVIQAFAPATVDKLRSEMAPLMQWVNIRGQLEARRLDLLIARMQLELVRHSSRFEDLKIELLDRVNALAMHLNPVREKADLIRSVKGSAFWAAPTPEDLENLRTELRTIIHLHGTTAPSVAGPKVVDVTDTGIVIERRASSVPAVDMQLYRQQVEDVLTRHFQSDPTLQKIRRGEPVQAEELGRLTSLVLTQHPDVDLNILKEFYDAAAPLDVILRSIVGLDPEAVRKRFVSFIQRHPSLTAKQTRFLGLLQNHLSRFGAIEVDRLYEDPFTAVDAEGLDGVFHETEADELVKIIRSFEPPRGPAPGVRS